MCARLASPVVLLAALLAGLLAVSAGCAGPAPKLPPSFAPIEPRVDAVAGAVLVLPMAVEGPTKPTSVRARLDDGRRLDAQLWWVATRAPDPDRTDWLPPTPERAVLPAIHERAGAGPGYWLATVDLPRATFGQGLWLNRSRIALRWLPDPAALLRDVAEDSPTSERPWTHPAPGILGSSPALDRYASVVRADPLRRWRHRLLTDGLEPAEEPFRPGLAGLTERDGAYRDPVLEAFALQQENRWRVALGWLWRDDPAAADALKRRLAATVRAGGELYPAWPTDAADLARLRQALLQPGRRAGALAQIARRFLEAQPAAAARPVERGAPIGGARATTIELANLGPLDALAWVSADGATPELKPVAAGSVAMRTVVQPALTEGGVRRVQRLQAHVGSWQRDIGVLRGDARAAPPGLDLGPLLRGYTLDAWLAREPGRDALPAPAWRTAARLSRASARDGDAWVLYVEAAWSGGSTDPGADAGDDTLTVHVGPRGDGRTIVVRAGGDAPPGVRVAREPDRWRAWIPLPTLAETPLIAIERTDARGVRTTWPERATPWTDDPGRETLDLNAWDPLSSGASPAATPLR